MRRRQFKPSGNSRPRTTPGDSTLMPQAKYDGHEIVDSKAIRYFRVDLSLLTETPHARIRKGVLQHDGVYGAELRGPVLYIKILVDDHNDVQADESVATAALMSALESLGVIVQP